MQPLADTILVVALLLASALGALLAVLQLPGTWLIVVAAIGYAWYYDWQRLGVYTLIATAAIAALAEVGEALSAMYAARRGGASRRAAWYGLAGGVIGALVLTIPVPLVGTLVGAALGCFAGAFLAEMQEGRGIDAGARSGVFSAVGRVLGSVLKVLAALIISAIVIVRAVAGFF